METDNTLDRVLEIFHENIFKKYANRHATSKNLNFMKVELNDYLKSINFKPEIDISDIIVDSNGSIRIQITPI